MTSEGSTVTHIMTDIETSREREGGGHRNNERQMQKGEIERDRWSYREGKQRESETERRAKDRKGARRKYLGEQRGNGR